MIATNTFSSFNPISLLFNDNQGNSSMQSKNTSRSSFEDVLNSTAQKNTADSVNRRDNSARYGERQNNDKKAYDAEKTQNDKPTVDNKVDNQDNADQRVAKKDSVDEKSQGRQDKFSALSDKAKADLKEMAEKLNIKPETLMSLLQTLNIDFKDLMQNSTNLEQALQKITSAVDNTVQELNLNPVALQNNDITAKIQLLLKQQRTVTSPIENDNVEAKLSVNADNEVDQKSSDLQNTGVELKDQSQTNTSKTDLQSQLNVEPKKKDDNVQQNSQINVDAGKDVEKKVFSAKSDKNFQDLNSNQQQTPQDADNSGVKAADKSDMSDVLNNIKVINLKTAAKENTNADIAKIDAQSTLPMQKFEGLTDKVIPLKQAIQNINTQRDNIFSQVVENAKLILSDNQAEMEMNLKPESLGKLSIKIATENGLVMAKIITENEQVKAAIEANLSQLKEQLQQQGLSVQDFSVSVGQDNKQQFFANQNTGAKTSGKAQGNSQNTVLANESYVNRIMVNNPYLMSDSSIDYTA